MLVIFPGGTPSTIAKLVRERWGVKDISAAIDPDGGLFAAAGVSGVPASILFDGEGSAVGSWMGDPGLDTLKAAFDEAIGK